MATSTVIAGVLSNLVLAAIDHSITPKKQYECVIPQTNTRPKIEICLQINYGMPDTKTDRECDVDTISENAYKFDVRVLNKGDWRHKVRGGIRVYVQSWIVGATCSECHMPVDKMTKVTKGQFWNKKHYSHCGYCDKHFDNLDQNKLIMRVSHSLDNLVHKVIYGQ